MPRIQFDPATDYYKLLGVGADAPPEEIQAAYRRLAKEYHPDLNAGSQLAAERMARLNVAKSVLLDRDTRAIYDQMRGPRRLYAQPVGATARPAGPRPAGPRTGVSASPPSDQSSGQFSVRYSPMQSTARARYRVVSNAATRAERRAGFDRGTGILLLIAVPLIAVLSLYVFQAMQLSIEPLKPASTDATLAPGQSNRPTTRGAADAVFQMVHAQPPSRELATRANNFILARSDSTPESEELRADGRKLVRSATVGDTDGWNSTVTHICQLADRC
jgi:curved DNA-binding protein CbpA